jgi:hypothetical protein
MTHCNLSQINEIVIFLSQLATQGLTPDVFIHCFQGENNGCNILVINEYGTCYCKHSHFPSLVSDIFP